jgi:glycosyltransferase involved in cell wall biosynthesis
MSSGPGISVVIPLYDKQAFIRRCLASIAAQSLPPDEVIVVDDGSTDEGPRLVAAWEGLPLRLIRQENAGVSAARNRGVAEARHDWIAFLDADDEYLPDAIERFRAARDLCPEAEVIFGQSREGGLPAKAASRGGVHPVPDYFAYLLGKGAHEANSSSVMIRKSAIEAAGLFPPGLRIGEDTDTWMRLGCLFAFARIDAPVSVYHMADGQSLWQTRQGTDPFWYHTYARWRDEGRIPPERRRSAARYFEFSKLQMVIFQARSGARAAAFRRLFGQVDWRGAPKPMLAKAVLIAAFPAILDWKRGAGRDGAR